MSSNYISLKLSCSVYKNTCSNNEKRNVSSPKGNGRSNESQQVNKNVLNSFQVLCYHNNQLNVCTTSVTEGEVAGVKLV